MLGVWPPSGLPSAELLSSALASGICIDLWVVSTLAEMRMHALSRQSEEEERKLEAKTEK